MNLLPFIEDDEENVRRIVEQAHVHGASYIIPWFGMSLRDRQRAYYYDRLDELFPGLRRKYERTFANRYTCTSPNAKRLMRVFDTLCESYGIATRIVRYRGVTGDKQHPYTQMRLF